MDKVLHSDAEIPYDEISSENDRVSVIPRLTIAFVDRITIRISIVPRLMNAIVNRGITV